MLHRLRLFALFALTLVVTLPAFAQTNDLQLTVRRNFGYGGGDQIQGSFRMEATGPADLARVAFKVDDQVVATVTAAPFRVDFVTDTYGLGWHNLTAEGQTASGQTLTSAPRRFEFVSAAEGWAAAGRIIVPILGALVLVGIVVAIFTVVDTRRGRSRKSPTPLGAARRYGVMGGAICPKCGRPFSRHWWAPNAGIGKLDRCPHCGRWSIVRAVPLDQLRAAEAGELQATQPDNPVPELSAEEKLRRQLDDSRYEG
jgi:Bacterial Ig domain